MNTLTKRFLAYRANPPAPKPVAVAKPERVQHPFRGFISNAETREERLDALFAMSLTGDLHPDDRRYLGGGGHGWKARGYKLRHGLKIRVHEQTKKMNRILATSRSVCRR
jgi:hypothetical protein